TNCLFEGGIFMGRTPKLTTEVKIELLEQYFAGGSPSKLSEEYGINVRTIEQWANRYREYGSEAFRSRQGNNSYTAEFKLQVVQDYMQSGVSEERLALKYDIPDRSTIHKWINKYNGHKGNLKSYKIGRTAMTKARKTTLDERLEVVNYCIDHGLNYIAAAEKFQVSYNQVLLLTHNVQ
ncbi:MAG: helix-turn-helix domain-containing protein, partial [Syntrophomonas sp.]